LNYGPNVAAVKLLTEMQQNGHHEKRGGDRKSKLSDRVEPFGGLVFAVSDEFRSADPFDRSLRDPDAAVGYIVRAQASAGAIDQVCSSYSSCNGNKLASSCVSGNRLVLDG
jgi:hypothetical protein